MKQLESMKREVATIVSKIVAEGKGLSDSRHQKIVERLGRKYRLPEIEVFVELDKQVSKAFGLEYTEYEEEFTRMVYAEMQEGR